APRAQPPVLLRDETCRDSPPLGPGHRTRSRARQAQQGRIGLPSSYESPSHIDQAICGSGWANWVVRVVRSFPYVLVLSAADIRRIYLKTLKLGGPLSRLSTRTLGDGEAAITAAVAAVLSACRLRVLIFQRRPAS